MANENDMEWFTPSVTLSDLQALSCYIFMNLFFPLIRESISEAIKRKFSNRDYKMEKIRGHVGNLIWYICDVWFK